MQKDLKIGMAAGLILVTIVAAILSTHKSLSVESRIVQPENTEPQPKPIETIQPPRFVAELPDSTTFAIKPNETKLSANTSFTQEQDTKKTETKRFHIVRKGQTLSEISYKYYGSANNWQKILDTNRGKIKNANRLKPGTKLFIPD